MAAMKGRGADGAKGGGAGGGGEAGWPGGEKPRCRTCGSMEAHFALLERNPGLRRRLGELDVALRTAPPAPREGVVRIPVVVHVVLRDPAVVTDEQVKSQITVLNKDFRSKNADVSKVPVPFQPLVADAEIEFALAKKDPEGKPTTGITRKKTTRASFGTGEDDVKSSLTGGVSPWDPAKYLNVWVCVLRGGILGYAQFPGGPAETDGVVILHTAFGTKGTAAAPFNKGRTTTHEVGHYLNLHHIWGDSAIPNCNDDDHVPDTPAQLDMNYGTPAFPHVSCGNGPHGDLFMNYMDYVDDAAMFCFTKGQVARMRAALAGPRKDLGT